MKKIILSGLLSMMVSVATAEVNFYVLPVAAEGDLDEKAAQTVYRKTEQILTRNSAAAAGEVDVFGIRAELSVTNENKTSGLVRDITSISGELTLTALNRIDNAKYYSVTVPLNAAVKGGTPAVQALANSIKTTDAVFTRFVRVARQKVDSYYEEHCQDVLNRAQTLAVAGDEIAALVYLTGLPPTAPCYEEGLKLIAVLRENISSVEPQVAEPETPAEEPAPAPAEPEPEPAPAPTPPVVAEPEPVPAPAPEKPSKPADPFADAKITLSDSNWNFRLKEATYLPSSKSIRIVAMVTYVGSQKMNYKVGLSINKVIDPDGEEYGRKSVCGDHYRMMPDEIPVKVEYVIENVKKNPGRLAFVGLQIHNTDIEIRNLKISNE